MRMLRIRGRRWLSVLPGAVMGVALLGAGFVQSGVASASFGWCAGDPVIAVNGKQFHVTIGVQGDPLTLSKSVTAADITVHLPSTVKAQVVYSYSLYFAEKVFFVYDRPAIASGAPIPVTVVTTFERPAGSQNLNTQMIDDTTGSGTVHGTLNGSMAKSVVL